MSSPQSPPPTGPGPAPAPRDGETRWLEIRRQELLAFARHLQRVRRRQREQDDHIVHLDRQFQERVEAHRADTARWAAEKTELEQGMAREVDKIAQEQQALGAAQAKVERERTEWQDLQQAHLDQVHLDLEALRKGNERLRVDLEKLNKDNVQLRTQVQEQEQERTSASHVLDEETARHEQQRRDFEEEITSLRKRLKDLETRQALPPAVPPPPPVAAATFRPPVTTPPPPPVVVPPPEHIPPFAAPPVAVPPLLAPIAAAEEEPPWAPEEVDPDDVLANLAPPDLEEEEEAPSPPPAVPVGAVDEDDDDTDLVQCETELSHLVRQLTAERQALEMLMQDRPPEGDLPDTKQVDLTFQRQRIDRTREGLHLDRQKLQPSAQAAPQQHAKPLGRIRGTLHGIRKWLGERS